MSKKRRSILTLCIVMAMAAAVLCGAGIFTASADVDAGLGTFRFLSVETTDAGGTADARIGFVLNKNLGTNSFATVAPSTDKVAYAEADGGSRTLTGVNYVWEDFLPKLTFTFAEDEAADGAVQYAVGDTVTIAEGFTFKNWDGSDLGITVTASVTVTYTEKGWTGSFLDSQLDNITVQNRTPGGIDVRFGYTGVSGNQIVMDSAHWSDHNVAAWERMSSYVVYQSAASGNEFNRFWIGGDGLFTVTKGDDSLHPAAGDIFMLKPGFAMWIYTGAPFMSYGTEGNSYHPVFVANEPITFVYDGSAWTRMSAVTAAEVANGDELFSIKQGQSVQIEWTFGEGEAEVPVYSSSDPEVAAVDEKGVISALTTGEVTITAEFTNVTKTIDITVAEPLAVTDYEFEIAGAAVRDGQEYLVAYANEELDKEFAASRLTATPVFNDGSRGTAFAVTADMLDAADFDNTQAGAAALTFTLDGVTADIPVWLYEVETVDAVSPDRLLTWDAAINVYFFDVVEDNQGEVSAVRTLDFRGKPEYGITNAMATLVEPSWIQNPAVHELYSVGEVTKLQCLIYFGGAATANQVHIPAGTVLTLTEDFRFYRNLDNTWVAVYKFAEEVRYVWTGSGWDWFTAEADDFTVLESEVTLPQGATYVPEVTILPEGAYGSVALSTEDTDVVTVEDGRIVAVAPGTATVTLSLGKISKAITVTVRDTEALGLELANDRTFYVAENGSFDISKVRVRVDYGDGFYGDEIALSPDTASFTLDTSAPGKVDLEIACTVSERGVTVEDTVTVTVDVQETLETYPDNLICNDDGAWSGTMIMIFFQSTFPNTANVYPEWLTEEEAATMTDYVSYLREGVTVEITSLAYLQNMLTFIPKINGQDIETYLEGDTILLKKGLCFYSWFGEQDTNHAPIGEGDFVKIGELKYDVRIIYNAQGKFAWHILPEDGVVLEETVTVPLGGQHAANVQIVPSYATQGEWFYTVEDETIVTVSTSGMIRGLAQGQTTVNAVLRDLEGTEIANVTFTVVVEDAVEGLIITSDKEVELDLGADLDVASWIEEFGIKAYAKYASGAQGEELIDLSGARVTGYDPETEGEQTLTFRVTVDGRSVTGTLVVTVGSGRNSCNSSLTGGGILASVLALAGAALCLKKRQRG